MADRGAGPNCGVAIMLRAMDGGREWHTVPRPASLNRATVRIALTRRVTGCGSYQTPLSHSKLIPDAGVHVWTMEPSPSWLIEYVSPMLEVTVTV